MEGEGTIEDLRSLEQRLKSPAEATSNLGVSPWKLTNFANSHFGRDECGGCRKRSLTDYCVCHEGCPYRKHGNPPIKVRQDCVCHLFCSDCPVKLHCGQRKYVEKERTGQTEPAHLSSFSLASVAFRMRGPSHALSLMAVTLCSISLTTDTLLSLSTGILRLIRKTERLKYRNIGVRMTKMARDATADQPRR